jgi:hypothetical protein
MIAGKQFTLFARHTMLSKSGYRGSSNVMNMTTFAERKWNQSVPQGIRKLHKWSPPTDKFFAERLSVVTWTF